jgi:hypothetical protein
MRAADDDRLLACSCPGTVALTDLPATSTHAAVHDGAENYRLRVPAGVPVKNFWSVTVYNNDTRYPITNDQRIADRSSRMDLVENDDGTIDIWFGPTAPTDKEQNWIPTNLDQSWFPYFRVYGPLEACFDRSWVLPLIERIGKPA